MAKKCKRTSDLNINSDIDSSGSAVMNAEDGLPDNRRSNIDNAENLDSVNNVRSSPRTLGEAYTC